MQRLASVHAARRVLFVAALLLASFALRCASALDECIARRDYECTVRQARVELYRSPNCCQCAFQLGLAERELAYREHPWSDVAGLKSALENARDDLKRAVGCKPKRREYIAALLETEERVRSIDEDQQPEIWAAVDAVSEVDARIGAVLAHKRYFDASCSHDIDGELNRYAGALRMMRSDAIRARLPIVRGTTVEAPARAIYIDALFRELATANDVDGWERSREVFQGTRYYALVDGEVQRALRTYIERLTEPDQIEAVCHRFMSDEDRANCADRVQRALVTRVETLQSAEAIEGLCPRLTDRSDREACVVRFRQTAVRAAETDPGRRTFAIARRACARAECWRRVMEITYSYEVRNAYKTLERSGVRGGPQTMGRSRDVWRKFIESLDAVAVRLFGGGASLRSMEPAVYADAVSHIDKARQESLGITRDVNRRWSTLLNDINTFWKPNLFFRSKWIPQIDREMRQLVTAVQLDSSNRHAHALIEQMMHKREKLDDRGDVQLKLAKVVFDIALGELTGYIPTKAGRIAVSVVYEALGL